MKKLSAVVVAVLLMMGYMFFGPLSPATAATMPNPNCTPQEAYDETIVDVEAYTIEHEAVPETFRTEYHNATWQRWTYIKQYGDPSETSSPLTEPDNWNSDNKPEPGDDPIGEAFQKGQGNGSWFYWTGEGASEEQISNNDGVDAWTEEFPAQTHVEHHDAIECPDLYLPHPEFANWLIPASWDSTVTPSYQEGIFPQDRLVGELECGRWSQNDTYWIDSQEKQDLYDSLGDVLTMGEDGSIYQSHFFVYGGDCVTEEPPVDICENLEGVQETVPEGYVQEPEGICNPIEVVVPPVDVCDNIEGVQETVPEGLEESNGSCVTPDPPIVGKPPVVVTPPTVVPPTASPTPSPTPVPTAVLASTTTELAHTGSNDVLAMQIGGGLVAAGLLIFMIRAFRRPKDSELK